VIRAVLDAIGSCGSSDNGRIRYAEPGEFTRRAFENERLDLTQIEGIGKLLVAETEEQRRAAIRQAEVPFSREREVDLGWVESTL
jgi:tRNA U34 5-carboxymethylaminomethyl modifying GTPase MnmE/TrmE